MLTTLIMYNITVIICLPGQCWSHVSILCSFYWSSCFFLHVCFYPRG